MKTVIAFILMFGLLVCIHELGHLIFAKRAGMLVREFSIGFGPKLFPFKKNETVYTIRLLPIGGYVRVAGEDPEIIELKPGHHIGLEFNDAGEVNKIVVNNKAKHPNARVIEVNYADLDHDLTITGYEPDEETSLMTFDIDPKALFVMDETETQIAPYDRQFGSKSVGKRAMQLFAGPMMNFVLAIVIFILLGLIQGVPTKEAMIDTVKPDTPAAEAGLEHKDEIIRIEGEPISTWQGFTSVVQDNPEEELDMTVKRADGSQKDISITPEKKTRQGIEIGQIGVRHLFEESIGKSFVYGVTQTYDTTKLILTNLGKLVTGQFSIDMLSGPVGIYDATDEIVQTGMTNFMMWTAMLSINLGIVNLVPLPALDGGRLLFVGIEGVRGRPIDPEKEGIVHVIGFALLMLLMLVVTWNDIQRLFL